jgi:hypothetical protein
MQFSSWASVLESCTDGYTIESWPSQNTFVACSRKYVTDYHHQPVSIFVFLKELIL